MKLYDKYPLKKAYYRIFTGMIMIPLFLVLVLSLLILGKQYGDQAMENIRSVQQGVAGQIQSDVEFMSMRLSQLTNVNDNMIIQYAVQMNEASDTSARYDVQKKLDQAGNLVIEPVKDVVSIAFYMKSGTAFFLKSNILRSVNEIRKCSWYQNALSETNSVKIGAYQTSGASDLYMGGGADKLVLIYALSPNVMIDRSQSIEMVVLYQTTDAGNSIRNYNRAYNRKNNHLGIMQIVDEKGEPIFRTEEAATKSTGYTIVRTPLELENTTWYIESHIKTSDLMQDFVRIAAIILLVAALIFVLAGYFSRYFIRQIVNPIAKLSDGLKQIEDGKLDIHITPQGQAEIRGVIHHFNAMARSLRSMVADYEEQVRNTEMSNAGYFTAMIRGELTPKQVSERHMEFFTDPYMLVGLYFKWPVDVKPGQNLIGQLLAGFERNPRYTLHCVACPTGLTSTILHYRITEHEDKQRLFDMIMELQSYVATQYSAKLECCIGEKCTTMEEFEAAVTYLQDHAMLRYLYGECAIVDLEKCRMEAEILRKTTNEYSRLADTLYSADAKNFTMAKETLFERLNTGDLQEAQEQIYGVLLAIAIRFGADGITLSEIFGHSYNYKEKVERLEDIRSMKMWITNYLNWVMDYSTSKIDAMETNVIVKAKRYLADHYDNAELTLSKVAEHVGLSEKYFTNRFTKETGETFSNYLTQLRIQNAKELLRTTTFRSYEIGEMVGYRNAEHFTRMFKKETGYTPAQYRKQATQ